MQTQLEIELACHYYYSTLLEIETIDNSLWQELTANVTNIHELDSEICDLPITYDECRKAIDKKLDFKLPGCYSL